ncbi:MAG TPA: class I SAM-dependent methyltransferase [Granulicella sp.]|jgi:predicted O-methyltransferase YrrM|nr:class I SAM-dependent methyltransferase [Granulicella sp.]
MCALNSFTLSKSLRLASVALLHPLEGYDRFRTILQVRRQKASRTHDYQWQDPATGLALLESAAGIDIQAHLADPALAQLEAQIQRRFQLLGDHPFNAYHNGDAHLARTCYAITRGLRPTLSVETGVCYGVTSACMLQAMQQNGVGHLHSIDLPPLARKADRYVGSLIPHTLRSRWTLHRGNARRLLAPLLQQLGRIDFFLHDSLHTHTHMALEFDASWAALRSGGLLMSDDIEGNHAFLEHVARPDVRAAVVMRFSEGNALFGIAVKA